jgi:tetratricopeptide (TPR) repeat protein
MMHGNDREKRTHIMAGAIGLAAVMMFGVLVWFTVTHEEEAKAPVIAAPVPIPVEKVAPESVQPRPAPPTAQEEAVTQISSYEADVRRDPQDADSPAKLFAMGNLYRQKLTNYEEAAKAYEWILMEYPDWEKVPDVYVQLSTCYERAGKTQESRFLYEEMMEKFPEENPLHQYAKEKLGL